MTLESLFAAFGSRGRSSPWTIWSIGSLAAGARPCFTPLNRCRMVLMNTFKALLRRIELAALLIYLALAGGVRPNWREAVKLVWEG